MAEQTRIDDIAELLVQAAHSHHEAFLATDGVDPEWPLWYAEFLHGRIDEFLQARPTRSKLVQCLLNAEDAHGSSGANTPWPVFYAGYLLSLGEDRLHSADEPGDM